MKKNRIRLTESQLHRVIKESVNKILNEIGDTVNGQVALGALAARKQGIKYFNNGEFNDVDDYALKQRNKTDNPSRLRRAYADSYMASKPGTPEETQRKSRREISNFYNNV